MFRQANFPLSAPVSTEEEEQTKRNRGSKLILSIDRKSVHSPLDEEDWLQNGADFQAGEELEATVQVTRHPESFELRRNLFWSDGMVRVSGREYNGLVKTPCFLRGDMSCLSCHSMHQSSPTNQLAKGMESNAACLQCHPSFEKGPEQHTHHAAGSSGS